MVGLRAVSPVPGVLLHVLLDHGELVGGHDGLQESQQDG